MSGACQEPLSPIAQASSFTAPKRTDSHKHFCILQASLGEQLHITSQNLVFPKASFICFPFVATRSSRCCGRGAARAMDSHHRSSTTCIFCNVFQCPFCKMIPRSRRHKRALRHHSPSMYEEMLLVSMPLNILSAESIALHGASSLQ